MIFFFIASVLALSFGTALSVPADFVKDVAFLKIGEYKTETYEKVYYSSNRMQALWTNTRSVCKAYGMDVLSLETLEEATHFLDLCQQNATLFDRYTHIGGMALVGRAKDSWYWVNSGKRIDYEMNFLNGQPDNSGDKEWCLTLAKEWNGFFFNDLNCYRDYEEKFICQKYRKIETFDY